MITLSGRVLSTAVGVVVLATGSIAGPASADTRKLIFDVFIPSRAPLNKVGMGGFAKEVGKLSGGTLELSIPTTPLGPPPRIFDLVEDGVADLALAPVIYRGNKITLPLINDLPFLAKSAVTASVATWKTHKKYFEDAKQWGPIMPIAIFTHGDEQFVMKSKAVKAIADLRGVKIVAPSRLHAARIKSLGSVPVGAPAIKMFELINGGVADGIIVPLGPAFYQGLVGVAKNVTLVPGGVSRPAFSVIINRKVFEGLTAKQQNAIMVAGGEKYAARLGGITQAEGEFGFGKFKEAGAGIAAASPQLMAEIRKRLAFIEADWLKSARKAGIDGPAALAHYRGIVAKMESK